MTAGARASAGRRIEAATPWLWAVASGGMIASIWLVSVPPFCLPFAFAPLFALWASASSLRRVATYGLVTAIVTSGIAFFWIGEAAERTFGLGPPWSLLCWLAFAFVANLHIPLIGMLWRAIGDGIDLAPWLRWTLLPLLWVSIGSMWPKPLPFDYGYPWLWSGLPVLQLADLVGFSGLALATFALNLGVARAWMERRERGASLRHLTGTIGLFGLLVTAGWSHGNAQEPADRSIRLRLVQPNAATPAFDPHQPPGREMGALLSALVSRSAPAPGELQPDVWIWPEGALPLWLGKPAHDRSMVPVEQVVRARRVPLLAGAGTGGEIGTFFNSMLALDEDARRVGTYRKSILFPFETWSGPRSGLSADEPLYQAGAGVDRTPTLELAGVRFGPSLCFEGLFPALFRTSAEAGAQIFVNLASDRRFGSFAEPYQHLFMTLARAIEFRRPVVRVAATGISAVISSEGTLLAQAPLGASFAQTIEVPYRENPTPTFYQAYGAVLPWLWTCLTLGICLLGALRRGQPERPEVHSERTGPQRSSAARPRWSWPEGVRGRELARRAALWAWVGLGTAYLAGVVLDQPWLATLGRVSGASPFPLVFGEVDGHAYWAVRPRLEATLRDGTTRNLEVDAELLSRVRASHRVHMLLALPYSFGPSAPRSLWGESLEHGLCEDGPIARAAGLTAPVAYAELTLEPQPGARRDAWTASVRCPA